MTMTDSDHDSNDLTLLLHSPEVKDLLSRYPDLAQLDSASDEQQEQVLSRIVQDVEQKLNQATAVTESKAHTAS
jgi:hypothetical protein